MNLIDKQGIHAGEKTIPWSDVREVAIRTTSEGPFVDDLFWVFGLRDGMVELPSALVNGEAVGAMQEALPNLDNMKVIFAMGSTSECIFRVWQADQAAWNESTYAARFAALTERLGGQASPAVFARLVTSWSAPERRYHNLEHLTDCLRELDAAGVPRPTADIAELALWYHDAVYVPTAHDNEERSAQLLVEDARTLGLAGKVDEAVACIRATAHMSGIVPQGSAAELVVDIDLAILGREPLRFMDYEYAIAEEYAAMSWTRYAIGRSRFLADLLQRPDIFRTTHFHERYEERARRNVESLLASRRYRTRSLLGWLMRLFSAPKRRRPPPPARASCP